MSTDQPTAREVEAVLKAARSKSAPSDSDLLPVYKFLFASSVTDESHDGPSTSSKQGRHFYCGKCPSDTHRNAATYLLFLFAFKRDGMPKRFLDELEITLRGCSACSRAFGGIRRSFAATYLAHFAPQMRKNFFDAVDKWQAAFILAAYDPTSTTAQSQDGESAASAQTLFSLPAALLQLLFSEANLLSNEAISDRLDDAIRAQGSSAQPSITSYGLSPLLVRMLSSPRQHRRTWALSQLTACARRPLSFDDYRSSGVGEEVKALYLASGDTPNPERLSAMEALLQSNALSSDAAKYGVIGGETSVRQGGHAGAETGFVSTLSHLLGGNADHYDMILNCFSLLVYKCPSPQLWAFDTSIELPHTLFSEIKDNASFHDLISRHYGQAVPEGAPPTPVSGANRKGKGKEADDATPFSWIGPFLRSTLPDSETDNNSSNSAETAFPQALAKVLNFCFAEMQHEQWSTAARAAAAQCGFEALSDLRRRLPEDRQLLQAAYSDTLQVHARFISNVALRTKDRPGQEWDSARLAAQQLLEQVFTADGRDIVESMLGLAHVAFRERRRLQRKSKVKGEAAAPQPVTKLHKATVRHELWQTAYASVAQADVNGVAIFIKSMAAFGHVDILDRRRAWEGSGLAAVIKEDDWIAAIRAINAGLRDTRSGFALALETLAMQPDTTVTRSLFDIPGVAKSAIILLLSPIDEIHDPMISLVQQAFDDADDRTDCFRILLRKFPDQAMDGLRTFLSSFIQAAQVTPDSCSLAKWLVRCFTDVIDVLCNASGSEPLLHVESFLNNHADSVDMSKRVADLWQGMTEALAVIFDRTKAWAPLYQNDVMVDWMRDALIFGRGMTEHIRVFEAAVLGQSGSTFGPAATESPIRTTHVGKNMVQKLEKVLKQLVSWLRLTDIETLHQTFELIKTIVGRIAKSEPDLTKKPDLEATLQDIDKFARKADKNHQTRLTADYLSELAGLLDPFDLGLADDEVQFVREEKSVDSTQTRDEKSFKPLPPAEPVVPKRNAFAEMMSKAGGKTSSSKTPSKSSSSGSKPVQKLKSMPTSAPIEIDDFDDDVSWIDALGEQNLDMIEKKARVASKLPEPVKPKSAFPVRHVPSSAAQKLNIDVRPRQPAPSTSRPAGSSFKTKFMQEMRKEHKADMAKRPPIGGVVPKLPAASALGTGLGAYTGPPRKIKQMVDSGSSASESSDEDNMGIKALVNRQKSPVKRAPLEPTRRIQVMQTNVDHAWKQREERRQAQQRIKQRLRPDMTPLFRYVLSWDPDHVGATPPHHAKFVAECSKLLNVPVTFAGAKQYEQVMLPLFLQELWAQTQQDSRSEPSIQVEISSRAYEDDFIDIDVVISEALRFEWKVNESDVVVLRQPGSAAKPILAKVQAFKRKPTNSAVKLRIVALNEQRELQARSKWTLTKHFSLSTAIREYGALRGLAHYEPQLLSDILAGRAARLPHLTPHAVDNAMQAYSVNEPQARAILGAMSVNGFALIQGPPGTGKTKTISGLVGKFLSERVTPIPLNGQDAVKPKLLVCAPSNAAIDEVCRRLMDGVPSAKGGRLCPKVVRVGIEKSVNVTVKDVSLDSLVEAEVAVNTASGAGTDYTRIQSELASLKDRIGEKAMQIQAARDHDDKRQALESEHRALLAKKVDLGKQASRARDADRDAMRHLDGARRAARGKILNDADIICATLSGAGHESLQPYTFETVIIDEAAQAIEMSCLIPLKYGCLRCIMVGDPNQLPPTVISEEVIRYQYNESLFVRIAKRDKANMHLLSIQYRMHPFISELPSKVFYDGQLKDGPGMATITKAEWHKRNLYGPYRFFNVDGMEDRKGTSTYNIAEARAAIDLYRGLKRDFGETVDLSYRIGIITMYREQLIELRIQFSREFGQDILQTIDFNTVDGFQGQEKDIIILSTVRSGPALQTIGFLRDPRRMNVALTRAKSSLFVIGNAATLERSDARWKVIVGDARDRGFLIDYDARKTFAPGPLDGEKASNTLPPIKVKKEKTSDLLSGQSSSAGTPLVGNAEKAVDADSDVIVSEAPPSKKDKSARKKRPSESAETDSNVSEKEKKKKKKSGIDPMSVASGPKPDPVKTEPKQVSGAMASGQSKGCSKPAPPPGLPPALPTPPSLPGTNATKVSNVPGKTLLPGPPTATINGVRAPHPPGKPIKVAPPPPARPSEDNLFIKKKKKNKVPGGMPQPPPSAGPSVRDRYR